MKQSSGCGSYRRWGRGGGDLDGDAAVRARDAADLLCFGRRGLGTVRSWAWQSFTVRMEGFTVLTDGRKLHYGGRRLGLKEREKERENREKEMISGSKRGDRVGHQT